MAKIYNLCLGKLVDKTPKWKTKGKKPEGFDGGWEWFKKQPPMPQRISICDKCNTKYYPKRRYSGSGFCYKRYYKSVNSVGTC